MRHGLRVTNPVTLKLPPELEHRLTVEAQRQHLPVDAYALGLLQAHLPASQRAGEAVALSQEWMDTDEADAQVAAGDWLVRALDEDRAGQRPLFPESLKGVTW